MLVLGCGGRRDDATAAVDPGPDLQVLGESSRIRLEDPVPATSPWFDGARVTLVAARGETLGLQVLHRDSDAVALTVDGAGVRAFTVASLPVVRPSTALYSGTRPPGTYADVLTPATAAPTSNPAYFEVVVPPTAEPGLHRGELLVGTRRFPVELTVAPVTLPPLSPSVWAYEDPREFGWTDAEPQLIDRAVPTPRERACVALFREHGVVLAPDLPLAWWPTRKELLAGFPHIPVVLPDDAAQIAGDVRGWIAATRGTGQLPFAIPVDEPRTAEARAKVRAIGDAVHAAGGGLTTFRMAVTAEPHPDFGSAVDLHISWNAAHLTGDTSARWTYNGAPPFAGSMTLDAASPGTRTWGWIAHRYDIPVWYVWDALYWHDRHNRRGAPLPGRAFDPRDPVTFDDGEDHGNLDGVLALPSPTGCIPTLRLAALRRGLLDRALLALASRCSPSKTAALATRLIPVALADAPRASPPSWPLSDLPFELARRELLDLASCR
ncbi:MAG: hypothetical protein KIT31_31305 [Deltaproteobacteria bacterium]|nr:hypothetical protein [Deltaproteobacteria bacterium]